MKKQKKRKSDFRDRRHEFIADPDVHKLIVLAQQNSESQNKSLIINLCLRRQLGVSKESTLQKLKENMAKRKRLNNIIEKNNWEVPAEFYDD